MVTGSRARAVGSISGTVVVSAPTGPAPTITPAFMGNAGLLRGVAAPTSGAIGNPEEAIIGFRLATPSASRTADGTRQGATGEAATPARLGGV